MNLHPQFIADCHRLGQLADGSCLLLHRNALLPWFILVPPGEAVDLLDLEAAILDALMHQAQRLAAYIQNELAWPRVNIGALGLVVPQVHLHVIGRRPDDACWPGPVWGRLPSGPSYEKTRVQALRAALLA